LHAQFGQSSSLACILLLLNQVSVITDFNGF
jgi:hypothetical protein